MIKKCGSCWIGAAVKSCTISNEIISITKNDYAYQNAHENKRESVDSWYITVTNLHFRVYNSLFVYFDDRWPHFITILQSILSADLHVNLHRLKVMMVESVPYNISCWGAVVFWEMSRTMSYDHWDKRQFITFCTHFSKTTAPQKLIISWKLSSIIIFKLCKFNVNLWTLCLLSYKST